MQMAVIEVAAGILKLPRRIWQLAPSGILQIVVGKGFDRFVYEPTKPAYRALVKISAKLYTSVT